MADRGYAESGLIHEASLQRVDRGGADARVDWSAPEWSGDLSDTELHGLFRVERRPEGGSHHAGRDLTPFGVYLDPHRGQLRHLLLEAHATQQIGHPLLDRHEGVAVGRSLRRTIVDSVAHARTPVE